MKIIQKSLATAYQLFPETYDSKKHRSRKAYHFAFAFDGNKLLAIGQNEQDKTSNKAFKFAKKFNVEHFVKYPFIHSEIDLISRLWGKYYVDSKIKMVVIRLSRDGSIKNSKPCKNCISILAALNVHQVWWSDANGNFQYGIN